MSPLEFVLVVMIYLGGSGVSSHSVDFKTLEACQTAQKRVVENARKIIPQHRLNYGGVSATCHKR